MGTKKMADAGNDLAEEWMRSVDRAEALSFTPVADLGELCAGVRASSCFWCAEMLAPAADPHEAEQGARAFAHAATGETPDLLRLEYAVQGLKTTLWEGRNFAQLVVAKESVDLLAMPPAARHKEIRRIAEIVLARPQGSAAFRWQLPRTIEEGTRFSTAPEKNPLLLASWQERVDGGIRRGELYFLGYKRVGKMVGYFNAREWYGPEFREKLRPA